MIVRWWLDELPERARRARHRAAVPRRERRAGPALDLPAGAAAGPRCRRDRIDELVTGAGADGLLAVGGGSAIDLAKAISAATGLPLVSVPTTYSGAEWTPSFGVRDPERRMRGGGAGAHLGGDRLRARAARSTCRAPRAAGRR